MSDPYLAAWSGNATYGNRIQATAISGRTPDVLFFNGLMLKESVTNPAERIPDFRIHL